MFVHKRIVKAFVENRTISLTTRIVSYISSLTVSDQNISVLSGGGAKVIMSHNNTFTTPLRLGFEGSALFDCLN